MNAILIAVGGHLLNAVAFIVDKSLLSAAFKRSGTYATVIGIFSSLILVLLPIVSFHQTKDAWISIAIFGSVFVLAMWAFFEALSRAETSRVVPVIGSLIPIFTLIDSAAFLNERLATPVLIGLSILLVATFMLTRGGKSEGKPKHMELSTVGLCVAAAFLFAASSVSGKYAFSHADFLDVFVLSRLFAVVISIAIPLFLADVRQELSEMMNPSGKKLGPKPVHVALMMFGQGSGALGFIGVQYAISLGSATVVNALQAVQYAAIVIVAWFGGERLAALLKEDRSRSTMIRKTIAIALVGCGLALVSWNPTRAPQTEYGFTWSKPYAEYLGMHPQYAFETTMRELKPAYVRLPAYWTEIQPTKESWNFAWLDAQLATVQEHGSKATIAIGARLPRWPECWLPEWVKSVNETERRGAQLAYLAKTYERYKDHPAVYGWQVENEALLTTFIKCPGLTKELTIEELRWVRAQEAKRPEGQRRPVSTTDSGELSLWTHFANETDALGVSVYRVVRSPYFGLIRYWFVPSDIYLFHASFVEKKTGPIFVSEFQMEPWNEKGVMETPIDEQLNTFDEAQMKANFEYAQRMGFPRVDFWGVEWWLWAKEKQNRPEFWEAAQEFYR